MATPKKFAIQQVFEILLRDVASKEIKAYLDDVKTSGLENAVEMTYPTGGRGNVYVGGAFAHSKRATLNVENATWNTEVMALQNGTEIVTSVSAFDITRYEVLDFGTGASGATANLKFTPTGTGDYIQARVLEDNGSFGAILAMTTGFTVSGKAITLKTALTGATKVAFTYETTPQTGDQMISVDADTVPEMAIVTAFGMAKDVCNGLLYPCQVEGIAQIDGNYSFDLSADGDPSVHGLNMEFVRGCNTKKLYEFRIYTDEVA